MPTSCSNVVGTDTCLSSWDEDKDIISKDKDIISKDKDIISQDKNIISPDKNTQEIISVVTITS